MPELIYRLSAHDLGFLQIAADLWGFSLESPDAKLARTELSKKILDPAIVLEVVDALPPEVRRALDVLIENDGWMAWTRFTRNFGPLREMGPGRRDREKPYLEPVSATEALWYRGLIGRDFLRRGGELQECAYIPDDLMALMPNVTQTKPERPGRPASPGEKKYIHPANDRILDHTCTLLAALRMEDPERSPDSDNWQPPYEVVHTLMGAMKLITSSEQPVSEDARPFLEMARGEALVWLVQGWRESVLFNELRLMPGLVCEGAWHNDPRTAREAILEFLSEIPDGAWWNLGSFISSIYQRHPDFQRSAGDFDTWLVRDAATGESLSGIEHWHEVDGALVNFLITGPMYWLGLVDLASRRKGQDITAFRLSKWAGRLLMGQPIGELPQENQPIEVFSDGKLTAMSLTPRLARYQVSRFCEWVREAEGIYTYLLTPHSLKLAAEQGLKITHLEILLNKYGESIPPNLINALRQWDQKGQQVRIQSAIILRVDSPQILKALRETQAGRFIGDVLGPTSAIIKAGAVEKVTAALVRLGYLSQVEFLGKDRDSNDLQEL